MLMHQVILPGLALVAVLALLAWLLRGVRVNPKLPPVVILDGDANALSVARDLSELGVKIYVICPPDAAVRFSRHCSWIDVPLVGSAEDSWSRFLLNEQSDHLRGAVLLTCSDVGITLIAKHRDRLASRFKLDDSNPTAAVDMLDKLTTYRHAQTAGVCTPQFWTPKSVEGIHALRDALKFPLLVKPLLSHVFEAHFGRKHVTANNFDQLLPAFRMACDAGCEVMLVELIPGGDDKLCSYYTYLDEQGKPAFHFTKRIIRRYPTGMGTACYHITDRIPELIAPSLKLFAQAGVRGLANVEFKLDERDGQYKLIECNARFTASNCLVSASGFSLARFIYNRIVGRRQEPLLEYRAGLRLWDPLKDFAALRELRQMGKLTVWGWLRSVLHRQTFPYFAWTDPGPAIARAMRPILRAVRSQRKNIPAAQQTVSSMSIAPSE
jgi:D-aspartate ligase